MTPSPCSRHKVPPKRLTAPRIAWIAGLSWSSASSGSRSSTIAVDSTMSAKNIETSLRSWASASAWAMRGGCGCAAKGAPHRLQKLLSARLGVPHWEHCRDDIRGDRYAEIGSRHPSLQLQRANWEIFLWLPRLAQQFKVEDPVDARVSPDVIPGRAPSREPGIQRSWLLPDSGFEASGRASRLPD